MTSSSFSSTTFKIRSPLHIGQARISIRSFFTKIHHQSHFCDKGKHNFTFCRDILRSCTQMILIRIFPSSPDMRTLSCYLHLILVYSPGLFTYTFCRFRIYFADFVFFCRFRILCRSRVPYSCYSVL